MYHTITTMSDYAYRLLCHPFPGTVHSVYRKTINIQIKGNLLALLPAASPLSPISLVTGLNTAQLEMLPVSPGQYVTLADGQITIAAAHLTFVFSGKTSSIQNLELVPRSLPFSCSKLETLLTAALSGSWTGGFQSLFFTSTFPQAADQPILLTAAKKLSGGRTLFFHHQYLEAARILCELIGLGIGLTPSGDDFLCGVLAGLVFRNMADHPFANCLRTEIELHLQNTNDISAAFLHCAVQNQFSQAVVNLFDYRSPDELFAAFSQIGHSSGIDSLCGILYSLQLV